MKHSEQITKNRGFLDSMLHLSIEDEKILSDVNYPPFFKTSYNRNLVKNLKDEFFTYIINAVHRFFSLPALTEAEKKMWIIAVATQKHGLIYYMNHREAQENIAFAFENSEKIQSISRKLKERPQCVRDIVNYAFHRFVYNRSERYVEKSSSELVSYDAITSIYSGKIAIRTGGPFDCDPDVSFFETNEEAKQACHYYGDRFDENYDGHHLAHYLAAQLGDYDYLDDDPKGSAEYLPKELKQLFTDPVNPFGAFVIFTRLLRPLFKYFDQGNEEKCVFGMANSLKKYLLAEIELFDPKMHSFSKPSQPINIVQLAVSVQSAIGEMPVSFAEAELFTRAANSNRPEDLVVDELEGCDSLQVISKIAQHEILYFQTRSILRQKAKLLAYLLVANDLSKSSSDHVERELLDEITFRIKTCNGAKINGNNLHHRLYETDLIRKYGYV
jgi:hypothetical protein